MNNLGGRVSKDVVRNKKRRPRGGKKGLNTKQEVLVLEHLVKKPLQMRALLNCTTYFGRMVVMISTDTLLHYTYLGGLLRSPSHLAGCFFCLHCRLTTMLERLETDRQATESGRGPSLAVSARFFASLLCSVS